MTVKGVAAISDKDKLDGRVLTQVVNLIEHQFGHNCEVVLHDLSLPYDSTIIDIRNGHITGRRVGDCGSNLGLEVIRGTVKDGDMFNYFTTTRDGKILRSSSIYLKDGADNVRYSVCVNVDITESVKFETYLRNQNRYNIGSAESNPHDEEFHARNIQELTENMFERGVNYIGKPVEEMTKNDKMRLIEFLDRKGVFMITKAGEKTCEALGITRYTFYNLLDAVRKNGKAAPGGSTTEEEAT
ncbi:MAG: helix-turn-helix transcriptional regulator [Defluviitaleaceae bacterium]|nr:helix-turn-helix transcriptional regulator [Defluviitaleaceae bacterium]